MHKRFFLCITFFLLIFTVTLESEEVDSISFGPATGKRLIFTLSQDNYYENDSILQNIIRFLHENPPNIAVSVLLPLNGSQKSLYTEAQKIAQEDESVFIVFFPLMTKTTQYEKTNPKEIVVEAGTHGVTSPLWLTQAITNSLENAETDWEFKETKLELYRMGLSDPNTILSSFYDLSPHTIGIHYNGNIEFPIDQFLRELPEGIPDKHDKHYLIYIINGVTHYISEMILVSSIIFLSAGILLFLFIFSFMFGKRKDQHVLDFLHVWWLPILFLIINILGLYIGGQVISSLFVFRFGNWDSWELLPFLAVGGKILISWFFIAFMSSLHQLFHLPEDDYIYGYIASLVCLINLFLFSATDFSLSITFLSAYFISFIAYHLKHPIFQIISIVAIAVPFYQFVVALYLNSNISVLEQLYTGNHLSNIQISFFVMPFQLLVSRLMHKVGLLGKKSKFFIPVSPLLILIPTLVISAVILFIPAWSEEKPLHILIQHDIVEAESTINTISPVEFAQLDIRQENNLFTEKTTPMIATNFIHTSSKTRRFLERQINTIEIKPQIKIETMVITVNTKSGIAVYTASYPFELQGGGNNAVFIIEDSVDNPVILEFSSDIKSDLFVHIEMYSKENPYGLKIFNSGIVSDYSLSVQHTLTLLAEKKGSI